MLTLDTFGPAFGEPDGSPFCVKAMCLLKAAGMHWTNNVGTDTRRAPFKKLPVLHDGETVVPDSDGIRDYLENVHGACFDSHLTAEQLSYSRALIRLAEEHLYFCLVYDRWVDESNWQHVKSIFFSSVPAALQLLVPAMVRRQVLSNLSGQGIGRMDYATMLKRAEHDIRAIETAIGDGPMLFGHTFSTADASVACVLAAIAGGPTPTGLRDMIRNNEKLMLYIAAVKKSAYPLDSKRVD